MYKFKFADIAEGLETGKVIEVLVKEGDTIEEGDDLFSVETEKVNTEIGAPIDGVIKKIYITDGEEIEVGQVVMDIDDGSGDNAAEEPAAAAEEEAPAPSVVGAVPVSNDVIAPRTIPTSAAKATPLAKKIAADKNINLDNVQGSGTNGRIRVEDLSGGSATTGFVNEKIKATPAVRRFARSKNIDLKYVKGSGPGGRILTSDVESHISTTAQAPMPTAAPASPQPPAPVMPPFQPPVVPSEPYTYKKMTGIRKAIARQMHIAKSTIPETTLMVDVELSELMKLRAQLKPTALEQGVKLTFMAFFTKACAIALKRHPVLNSSLDMEKDTIVYKNFFNIGIAVDSPAGLMVPVVNDADQKSILRIAAEIVDLAGKVRAGTIKMTEMRNSTFTISNYGSVGVEYGTPVINYPEAAILGIGTIVKKPIVNKDNQVVPGNVLPLSITIDHRTVDGADGGRFLSTLKNLLENPLGLML